MKKVIYIFTVLSLAFSLCGCGSSGGGEDDPDDPDNPMPGEQLVKVECVLKSGIGSLDDSGVKDIISHVRLYVFDQEGKLKSSSKYNSVSEVKNLELSKGNYTVVLVGNVPDDENISGDVIGTALSGMKIQLTKEEGALNFTPLGDVLFAKNVLTVGNDDTTVELTVKRTLAATTVQMTDYSGKIAEAGVLVPNVGTTLGFGETEWKNPGTVFMTMTKKGMKQQLARADEESLYSATMNIVVIGENDNTGKSNNVECNIIAKDETQEVILSQALTLDVETKPDMQVVADMEVNESTSGNGQLESSVQKVETTDESGKTETLPNDKIEIKENDVKINVSPGEWQAGNTEDVEIGEPEGTVRPGGTVKDWVEGNQEDIVIGD